MMETVKVVSKLKRIINFCFERAKANRNYQEVYQSTEKLSKLEKIRVGGG